MSPGKTTAQNPITNNSLTFEDSPSSNTEIPKYTDQINTFKTEPESKQTQNKLSKKQIAHLR